MKKKITLVFAAALCSLFATAQSFTALYGFTLVTTTSGIVDPTPVPTAAGVTFGSFSYTGTQTNPNAGGRFSFTAWPVGALNADDTYTNYTGSLDPANYYEVTVTPNAGSSLSLSQITFDMRRSGTGPRNYAVRSSADGYAANLPASINPMNSNLTVEAGNVFFWAFDATVNTTNQLGSTITLSGASFTSTTSAITFRVYAWNAEASGGSFSIDNFTINGSTVSTATVISMQPRDTTVCTGSSASFTAAANNAITYQWEENNGSGWLALSNGGVYSGTSTASLSISNAAGLNTYQYRLIASGINNDTTIAATLTVLPLVTPSVTISPASITLCEYDSLVVVAAGVNGGPNPAYDWYVTGQGLVGSGDTLSIGSGIIPAGTYELYAVLTSDAACTTTAVDTSNYVYVTANPLPAVPVITQSGNVLSTTAYSSYQWYLNSSTALGTGQTETAAVNGNYEVVVTNSFGCYNVSAIYSYTASGINDLNNNLSVDVFPNPSNDGIFTINTASKFSYAVFNIVGKKLISKEEAMGKQIIDLSAQANGSYFVTIKTDKEVITKKIVLNK